jgi:hypothetical protein
MKASRPKFQSESELAKPVVSYLHEEGWEVWQEVQLSTYSRIADIVAFRNPVYWIIECKLRFGLEVVDQARGWRNCAHYVSVAVPYVTDRAASGTLDFVCRHFGIGMIEVIKRGEYDTAYQVNQHRELSPSLLRHPKLLCMLKDGLRDEQKTWAEAGNHFGRRFTPFAGTCYGLARVVAANPGVEFSEALANIKHHYASDQSARSSLLRWVEAGKVKEVQMVRDGRRILLFHPNDLPAKEQAS